MKHAATTVPFILLSTVISHAEDVTDRYVVPEGLSVTKVAESPEVYNPGRTLSMRSNLLVRGGCDQGAA